MTIEKSVQIQKISNKQSLVLTNQPANHPKIPVLYTHENKERDDEIAKISFGENQEIAKKIEKNISKILGKVFPESDPEKFSNLNTNLGGLVVMGSLRKHTINLDNFMEGLSRLELIRKRFSQIDDSIASFSSFGKNDMFSLIHSFTNINDQDLDHYLEKNLELGGWNEYLEGKINYKGQLTEEFKSKVKVKKSTVLCSDNMYTINESMRLITRVCLLGGASKEHVISCAEKVLSTLERCTNFASMEL